MTQEEKKLIRRIKLGWIKYYIKCFFVYSRHYLSLAFVIPAIIIGCIAVTLLNIITLFKFVKYLIPLKEAVMKAYYGDADEALWIRIHSVISHFAWIIWILVLLIALIVRIY